LSFGKIDGDGFIQESLGSFDADPIWGWKW